MKKLKPEITVHFPNSFDEPFELGLFKNMLRIRRLEELCAELYTQEKIRGFLHLYIGEEAVATGVLSQARAKDNVIATYREHGHALLKGLSARSILAEMFGKRTGCCRGRGGSMHLFSKEHRFFGGQAIVGAGLPHAVGLALASEWLGEDRITFCFFGDGAVAEGQFHESLNLAALWKLPVLFCCENNFYGMGTAIERAQSQTNLVEKAKSYKIQGLSVDGMDVDAVVNGTRQALFWMQENKGPFFLELKTYRFRAHSMFDPDLYRSKEEVLQWKQRCPIEQKKKTLRQKGLLNNEKLLAIEKGIQDELSDAKTFAEASPFESPEDLYQFVYAGDGL
ncbi:MAG: pyruvate dehydrogenase (acetyl-transferring) component subunit alpha [Pseudomonadota bacterium]|jgi:pyruvate dehydrogenase E1 component alpha subunit